MIVPRGFVTDLASIPRQVRLLLPATTRYGNAALVHDYLYWRQDCTRKQSDNIMAIALMEAGVSVIERTVIYEAVRNFGQGAWDANAKNRRAGLMRTVAPPNDNTPLTGTGQTCGSGFSRRRRRMGGISSAPVSLCDRRYVKVPATFRQIGLEDAE